MPSDGRVPPRKVWGPIRIVKWQRHEIRASEYADREYFVVADIRKALDINKLRCKDACAHVPDRHKERLSLGDAIWTMVDGVGLQRVIDLAPVQEHALSLRRELLAAPVESASVPPQPRPEPDRGLIVREYRGTTIRQRADGWICLTDMACATGKDVWSWKKALSTQQFLVALQQNLQTEVLESRQGNDDAAGTWAHPQVAHHFAMWCSPEFAVKVTGWVEEIRTKGFALDEHRPESLRDMIRTEVRAILRDEIADAIRAELPQARRVLPAAPSPAAGEMVRTETAMVIGLPKDGEYRTVADVLRAQRIFVPKEGPRHQLGRKVSVAYQLEAMKHRANGSVWPPKPLHLARAGNYYPAQTWSWLDGAVVQFAGAMGYLPRSLQASLFDSPAMEGRDA